MKHETENWPVPVVTGGQKRRRLDRFDVAVCVVVPLAVLGLLYLAGLAVDLLG